MDKAFEEAVKRARAEELRRQLGRWASDKECPGELEGLDGRKVLCGERLALDVAECPMCRHSFAERH